MENVRYDKGITLIALVITIIVLLILAAISIATLTGENGILTKANTAKQESQRADIIERAKTDILGNQAENKSGEITKNQFKSVLTEYFKDVPQTIPDDITKLELTAKDEYGGHKIKAIEIYEGTFAKSEELVKCKINETDVWFKDGAVWNEQFLAVECEIIYSGEVVVRTVTVEDLINAFYPPFYSPGESITAVGNGYINLCLCVDGNDVKWDDKVIPEGEYYYRAVE